MTDRFDREIRIRDHGNENIILPFFLEDTSKKISSENKNFSLGKKVNLDKFLERNEPRILLYNFIDTSIVENREFRDRSDRFITRELERLDIENFLRHARGLQNRSAPIVLPEVSGLDRKKRFSSTTGLSASVVSSTGTILTVRGETVTFPDNRYTMVNFIPGGRTHLDASKMTDSLVKGISGIKELVGAIDSGDAQLEPIFVGVTNINMALIAQRLGFTIADECRKPDGTINETLSRFTVVGNLADIRQKIKHFEELGASQRIASRAQRLTLKPA